MMNFSSLAGELATSGSFLSRVEETHVSPGGLAWCATADRFLTILTRSDPYRAKTKSGRTIKGCLGNIVNPPILEEQEANYTVFTSTLGKLTVYNGQHAIVRKWLEYESLGWEYETKYLYYKTISIIGTLYDQEDSREICQRIHDKWRLGLRKKTLDWYPIGSMRHLPPLEELEDLDEIDHYCILPPINQHEIEKRNSISCCSPNISCSLGFS